MPASERYELLEELGRGGMGVVYRARDRTLGREVAIKMLRRDGEAKPHLLARMMREAQVVATLEHPGIVRIHDVLEDALVMEFVRGRPLDLGTLPLAERLKALEDVARAIQAAHERGVVHRDLKPGNVLREETGRVVVMDFGLAHLAGARSRLTRSGAVMGTPLYMAPEQIRGERVDGRADVYSLGVMLYEALAGRVPFKARTVAELYAKVLTEDPPPLKGVAKDLATICRRSLARDLRDRYRTAGALAEDLASHRAGRGIATRPMSTWTRLVRRKAVMSAAAMGLLVVFAAGAALKLRRTREGVTEAQRALVEEMRRTSATCLEAALDLRRVGKVDRMGEYASKVYAICDRVIREHPRLAEPHYLRGRMYRALMKDKEALEEQERALAKEPGYASALYERVVLVARCYRRRVEELAEEERRRRLPEERSRLRRSWELAEADPKARGLMKRMEEDLARLKAGGETLSAGQRACAEGLRAWAAHRCGEVRSVLEEAVSLEPYLEEPYEALASHEEWHGRDEEAVRWWTEGIAKDRGYVIYFERRGGARINWGMHRHDHGEDPGALLEAAIEDFREVLRLDSRRELSWMGLGMARMSWGVYKAERGDDPGALFEGAIQDYGKALELDPERGEAWMWRGAVRAQWGKWKGGRGEDPDALYERAIEDYGEALRLNPGRDEAWSWRGMARTSWGFYKAERGDDPGALYEGAIQDYGKALELDPEKGEAWMGRGAVRANWGRWKVGRGEDPGALYERAIEDCGEALRLDPRGAETWTKRGAARMCWGNVKAERGEDPGVLYEGAVEDCGEALKRNPRGDETWVVSGMAQLNWGTWKGGEGEDPGALYEGAVRNFEKALAINRSRVETWRFLGQAYDSWDRHLASRGKAARTHCDSALKAYRQAVSLNPAIEKEVRPLIEDCRRRIGSASGE